MSIINKPVNQINYLSLQMASTIISIPLDFYNKRFDQTHCSLIVTWFNFKLAYLLEYKSQHSLRLLFQNGSSNKYDRLQENTPWELRVRKEPDEQNNHQMDVL